MNERSNRMEINFKSVIQSNEDQMIQLSVENPTVIHTNHKNFDALDQLTHQENIFQLQTTQQFYKRLTVREQVNFLIKWCGSSLHVDDLLSQFMLLEEQNIRIQIIKPEMIQRISFIHALLANESIIVTFNPFIHSSNENIHLFHKLIEQLKHAGRKLLVITSRIEDAFIIQPNIWSLKATGLEQIITEENELENNDSAKIPSKIKVKVEDKTIFVDIEAIEYVESHDGKVVIMIEQERYIYDSTLGNAEILLKDAGFYRCHRSYLVNLNKVNEIINWSKNSYSVVIKNSTEDKIPLSRTKYSEIQELLINL